MAVNYPRLIQIAGISNEINAEISFDSEHTFTDGEIVSFRVTHSFGMSEINDKRGRVLTHDDTSIVVDIDTTTWTPFTLALLDTPKTTPPVCLPSCSGVVPNSWIPQTNLLDAFDVRRN